MTKSKKALKKYNDYISGGGEKNLTEYMYLLHDVYPELYPEDKENAYLYTIVNFPQTIAYAMLKLSSIKLDVTEKFREEYKQSYKSFLDDIDADLSMGFGDDRIFLTYARMYVYGMNEHIETLMGKIETKFKEMRKEREEKERQEWIHKKIY